MRACILSYICISVNKGLSSKASALSGSLKTSCVSSASRASAPSKKYWPYSTYWKSVSPCVSKASRASASVKVSSASMASHESNSLWASGFSGDV